MGDAVIHVGVCVCWVSFRVGRACPRDESGTRLRPMHACRRLLGGRAWPSGGKAGPPVIRSVWTKSARVVMGDSCVTTLPSSSSVAGTQFGAPKSEIQTYVRPIFTCDPFNIVESGMDVVIVAWQHESRCELRDGVVPHGNEEMRKDETPSLEA